MVAVKCLMSPRHPSAKRGDDDHFILLDWSLSRKNISGLLGSSHLCSDFIDFGLLSRQLVSEPLVLSNAVYVLNRILASLINLIVEVVEILSWLSTLVLIMVIDFTEQNFFYPLLFHLRIIAFFNWNSFFFYLIFLSGDWCFCFNFIRLLASFELPVQQNFSNLGSNLGTFLDFLIGVERIRLVVHEFLQMGLLIHESFIRLGMKSECFLVEFLGPLSSCSLCVSFLFCFICYLLDIYFLYLGQI